MISGRGGTGKTEVVSAVLGYAEREIDYVGDVNVCMFIVYIKSVKQIRRPADEELCI